jgi:voltage-gated potassium channel
VGDLRHLPQCDRLGLRDRLAALAGPGPRFRAALASQRFGRRVARLREPFLLLAGYGQTGQIVGQALDADGRRFTVVDLAQDRVDTLDVESFRSDVPGLAGDAGVTENLQRAGLAHPGCAGVLALTNDDAANLSVVMAAALLRPDLPVVARTVSPSIARRMRDFGTPAVVNPYDDFGDHLRVALRAPATYQLTDWLTSPPGSELPPRQQPPPRGPWTVLSTSRFGREVTADLRADGLPVGIVDVDDVAAEDGPDLDDVLRTALAGAVGFVAAADDDLLNLSALQLARQRNPQLFVIARQNDPANAPLLRALSPNVLLVAAEVIAHEVLARLGSPTPWAFLRDVRGRDDAWAGRLAVARVPLGDLLRSPDNRARPLDAVPLLLVRDGERLLTPELDRPVQPGDTVRLAGRPGDRRALDATLRDAATSSYVITGEQVATTWLGRQLRRGGSDAGNDSDFRIESH